VVILGLQIQGLRDSVSPTQSWPTLTNPSPPPFAGKPQLSEIHFGSKDISSIAAALSHHSRPSTHTPCIVSQRATVDNPPLYTLPITDSLSSWDTGAARRLVQHRSSLAGPAISTGQQTTTINKSPAGRQLSMAHSPFRYRRPILLSQLPSSFDLIRPF